MPPPSSSVGAARPPRHASISPRRRRALTRLALLILLACVVWSERPGGALRASRDHVRLLERFAESSDADAVPGATRSRRPRRRRPAPADVRGGDRRGGPDRPRHPERSRLYATQAGRARRGVPATTIEARRPTTRARSTRPSAPEPPPRAWASTRPRSRRTGPSPRGVRRTSVRAIVVPLPARSAAARRIRDATRRAMTRWFPNVPGESESESSFARRGGVGVGVGGGATRVWYQDPRAYHFSVFHASHHLDAHPALGAAAAAESAAAGRRRGLCPVARRSSAVTARSGVRRCGTRRGRGAPGASRRRGRLERARAADRVGRGHLSQHTAEAAEARGGRRRRRGGGDGRRRSSPTRCAGRRRRSGGVVRAREGSRRAGGGLRPAGDEVPVRERRLAEL